MATLPSPTVTASRPLSTICPETDGTFVASTLSTLNACTRAVVECSPSAPGPEHRRFGRRSALRVHTKALYRTDLLWEMLRALKRPGRARTVQHVRDGADDAVVRGELGVGPMFIRGWSVIRHCNFLSI